MLKTEGAHLSDVFDRYKATYDYVLTVFFKNVAVDDLRENPKLMEIMLLILVFKMGIHQTDFKFTASKTFLGKRITKDFITQLKETCRAIETEDDLATHIEKY